LDGRFAGARRDNAFQCLSPPPAPQWRGAPLHLAALLRQQEPNFMLQSAILITLLCYAALVAAYFVYGRFLARTVFRLDDSRPTPAHKMEDGVDYVPTSVPVLFGHHFASIAGLGPILGPAVAVIWGWLPAVLWVVFGCIFLGAVHDLGAMTVSLRFNGRSIGDVGREIIGTRARLLFLLIIFFAMSLAMGAFVNAISSLFVMFNPDAIIPSFGLMVVAVGVGIAVYKLRAGLGPATVVGLALFAGLILWGVEQPVRSYEWFVSAQTRDALAAARAADSVGGQPAFAAPYGAAAAVAYLNQTGHEGAAKDLEAAVPRTQTAWIFALLAYAFIASVLPVWLLLQPRDYINSFQLYVALALLLIGLVVASIVGHEAARIDAPAVRVDVPGAPGGIFPFLFVTIACGAVSGFHSLVSSGTTVRQLNREGDALPIGFGAMLTEGALAILVIMACVAGLGAAAWSANGPYAAWTRIGGGGLAAQLSAVVNGGATFASFVGVPTQIGKTFLAVTIVAFALTTLDSATRLLRFNVEEFFRAVRLDPLANRYVASMVAVIGIAAFGLAPAGKPLWILFGSANQLLAGLTLLTVSLFLYRLRRPVIYTLVPMAIMLVMTIWAMIASLVNFYGQTPKPWLLIGASVVLLALSLWLLVEAAAAFGRRERLVIDGEPPEPVDREQAQAAASSHLG
jgi:carbon starvation protein